MPDAKTDTGYRPRILLISQVYVPDPTAVGQYMADAAAALVERGYEVRVLTSARGYDDPSVRYPLRETRDGVEILRMPFSSFGKRTIAHRLLGQMLFLAQVFLRGLFTPRLAAVLVSTSPPMASVVAVAISLLRRKPLKFWAMDLNPDQMIALGRLRENSLAARVFNVFNRILLRRATDVVALDRFMADRLCAKVNVRSKLTVLPPWPHLEHLEPVAHDENPFRKEEGLGGKFVVMYSGNHGYSTPVETIVEAALRMQDREDLVFLFIGGGVGKEVVDAAIREHQPTNLRSLPYQPLEKTRFSLSAADVHLVTVGNEVVGVVHPCKVYGALALGRPILLLGPNECHVSDLIDEDRLGWHISHGDVDGAVAKLDTIRQTPYETLREMGDRCQQHVRTRFDSKKMIETFCQIVARGLPKPPLPASNETDGDPR